MLASSLRRGLAAGLVAGFLAGLFALVVGHNPMAEAIRLEEQAHHSPADDPAADDHAHDHDGRAHDPGGHADEDDGHEHLFSRATQRLMLPVATTVVGLALGGLFGIAFAFVRPRLRETSAWRAHLKLGVVAWAVTVLAPALTFPPNPPGVGDPEAIDGRTGGYLLVIGSALAAAVALWVLAQRLRSRTALAPPIRQILVGGAVLAVGAVLLSILPRDLPGDGFPAELLWSFRFAAIGTQTLLWVGITTVSGLLWERSNDRAGTQGRLPV